MDNPTNGELAIMIGSLRELTEQKFKENADCHARVDEHLIRLNGQVTKNTVFRIKWAGAYFLVGVIGAILGIYSMLINVI